MLLLLHIELFIDLVHSPGIEKDQGDKGQNGSLLGEPETKVGPTYIDAGQQRP
jgi:hypothetical protein